MLREKYAELDEGGDAIFAGGEDFITNLVSGAKQQSSDATTGNYNHVWVPDRDFIDNRTSLITDPPDGRLPPMTPAAKQRQAAAAERRRLHPADGPEDRSLVERCLAMGVPRKMLTAPAYNNYTQIFQSRDHVVILMEMAHDARIIPLTGGAVPTAMPQWHGISRGRFEGDTLVIETASFSPKSDFLGSNEGLRIIERLTRVSPDRIQYEVTTSDPSTWEKHWTGMAIFNRTDDAVYEYACHEGNHGMIGILAGARAEENAVAINPSSVR